MKILEYIVTVFVCVESKRPVNTERLRFTRIL